MCQEVQGLNLLVGDFGHGDASIQVTGLQSAQFYTIRVIATNTTNFSTLGPLIRLRTKLSQSASPGSVGAAHSSDANCDSYNGEPASVRATPSQFDVTPSSNTYQVVRETSGNSGRKTASGRVGSSLTHNNENMVVRIFWPESDDENEAKETMQRLTQKLGIVRQDQQDIDRQIREEEQEAKHMMTRLIKDRDQLKNLLKDKEDISSDLRKHGNHLDKLNRNAQSRKAAKEKVLLQKRVERQRMEDEITRWDWERLDMSRIVDEMLDEKARIIATKKAEVAEVRRCITNDQALIKSVEEDMRVKGIQIKVMEQKKETPYTAANLEQEQGSNIKDFQYAWEVKFQTTQAQLTTLWQALQQVFLLCIIIRPANANKIPGSSREPKSSRILGMVDLQTLKRSNPIRYYPSFGLCSFNQIQPITTSSSN